ncbi:MFS general substrate transporter [Meredithblackwellia eburnea MCA 4105]
MTAVQEEKSSMPIHLEQQSPPESDHPDTARIIRKLDYVIVPFTTILYLAAYLDRGNIGNAKLLGLFATLLHNDSTKYSIAFAAFYISYIIFNVPGNILTNVLSPNLAIGGGAMLWGIASSAQAGATSFAGIVVCRLFIGIGEAAFGTAVPLYFSRWYRREEVAKRNSFYIGAGALAGTFGGLIAYGVGHLHSHLQPFRILFLIEGLPTILFAALILVWLPSTPETTHYLTEPERQVIVDRLSQQGLAAAAHKFDSQAAKRAFWDIKSYAYGVIYLGVNLTLSSISGFLPTIITTFGYTATNAQLATVPPYAVAFVVMLSVCFISDRIRARGLFVVAFMLLAGIGFVILLAVHHNQHVRYFATFLVVTGAFTCIPLMLSWVSNNASSHTERAVQLGLMNGIGQCFAILAAFSFPTKQGPKFIKGFALNLAFNLVAAIVALVLWVYFRGENARRDEVAAMSEGNESKQEDLMDLTPTFRYTT